MRTSWIVGSIIVVSLIVIVVIFNHQAGRQTLSLNEIFPEEIIEEGIEDNGTGEREAATLIFNPPIASVGLKEENATAAKENVVASSGDNTHSEVTISNLENIAFTIQISSFKDKAKADKVFADLKNKGFAPFVITKDLADRGVWYRVYVGEFNTKEEAQALLDKIRVDYPQGFIIAPGKRGQ